MTRTLATALLLPAALVGCGDSSPGRIQGTWQAQGVMPMKVVFREGETETMGLIEEVGYSDQGDAVLITYKDGMMKGSSVRWRMLDEETAQALGLTYKKVSN